MSWVSQYDNFKHVLDIPASSIKGSKRSLCGVRVHENFKPTNEDLKREYCTEGGCASEWTLANGSMRTNEVTA